jgi:hypothetical protein
MQTVFAYSSVAVVIRHWFEIGADDEEHGCRVELRVLPQLTHRGTESASQLFIVDRPLWRADLFDLIGAAPGNHQRAHYHPTFEYTEPSERVWDQTLAADPPAWAIERLRNLALSVDERTRAELDLGHDQDAVIADLREIEQTIVRRMGSACRSPAQCLSQTHDVRYVVPRMFAEFRPSEGIDPRDGASTWADVVASRRTRS